MAAAVQVRLATLSTGKDYVTGKLWQLATLRRCPWHRQGGCGFSRHGTYSRVKPRGTLVARWYCPTARCTVSALPDCLASHYSGTLCELEAHVRCVEQARSLFAAAADRRLEIELPGALRYLSRVCKAVHTALDIVRGLLPASFVSIPSTVTDFSSVLDTNTVLMNLRTVAARWLAQLPTPLGFNPSRAKPRSLPARFQQQTGRDPPCAFIEPAQSPGRRPEKEQPH